VVFDIDGVLSDATRRQHFIAEGSEKKNWRAFFDACGEDALIAETARLIELLDAELTTVLLTGRPVRVRKLTTEWLDRHQLRWDLLVMRDTGDYSKALEFKRRTISELRDVGLKLELAFEDDARNREMFHDEGVLCVYIHSGYYE
jgi:hypothetical protein